MKNNESKSRNYCFTINNYTQEDLERLHELGAEMTKHHFLIFGLELAPETGTKHVQGYIQLNEAQRFKYLHKYFNLQRDNKLFRFHIDIANGTPEQNINYCSKDGDFYQYGTPVSQGKRTDMIVIKELVKENPKQLNEVIDERANNLQQLKFAQSIQQFYLKNRDPNYPPKVFWIFGSTGAGKTSLVYQTFDDVCSVSSPRWAGTGYNQNECLLFDDIREFDIPFNDLLKITDRFPYTLERKHGHIPLNSPFIIFTSPRNIDHTFISVKENLAQLKRRLVEINLDMVKDFREVDLKNLDEKYIWNDVNNVDVVW